MATIAPINIASSTATNWLKEAQESLVAAENPGGLMGALQDARYASGSIKTFLAKSQNDGQQSGADLAEHCCRPPATLRPRWPSPRPQKRADEKIALHAEAEPDADQLQSADELDPFIYFDDGSSIDTANNILTHVERHADRHHHRAAM